MILARSFLQHATGAAHTRSIALAGLWFAALAMTAATPAAAMNCADLVGQAVPSVAIGLPTGGALVDEAQSDRTEPGAPVCVVKGRVRPHQAGSPEIRFQLNLPEQWNGKAVHVGGGGFNGILVDGRRLWFHPAKPNARAQKDAMGGGDATAEGYATFGSDAGHQWDGKSDPLAFALDDEALRNYGGDQLKKVRDVTGHLIRSFYGRPAARTYFFGGSKGGQESLAVAQRWPDDYDGVVVFFPGYNFAAQFYATYDLVKGPPMGDAALERVAATVLAVCDPLDGLADGLVGNVAACRTAFKPRTRLCQAGESSTDCLAPVQLDMLIGLTRPRGFGFAMSGITSWPGWPFLDGVPASMLIQTIGSRAGAIRQMTDQSSRAMILKDPAADLAGFDPVAHAAAFQNLSALLDASSPNLDRFRARGSKLILMQGTIDTVVPAGNTIAYWQRLQARYRGGLDRFARFYMVPGFGHGTGPFIPTWDALAALDDWVGNGNAPGTPVASDLAPGNARRSRPICQYPAWPKYRGGGDPNDAASFACAVK